MTSPLPKCLPLLCASGRGVRGVARLALVSALIGITALSMLPTRRLRWRGVLLPAWMTHHAARLALALYDVRLGCVHPERLALAPLLFPNHSSYLDMVAVSALTPARFLSADYVRDWLVLGWIARASGAVFVNRSDKASRHQARLEVARAIRQSPRPPFVVFPEGGIGDTWQLRPFRRGAFAMAAEHGLAYALCALRYDRPDITFWRAESLFTALWRLSVRSGPVTVNVHIVDVIHPAPTADGAALAEAAYQTLAAALR